MRERPNRRGKQLRKQTVHRGSDKRGPHTPPPLRLAEAAGTPKAPAARDRVLSGMLSDSEHMQPADGGSDSVQLSSCIQ